MSKDIDGLMTTVQVAEHYGFHRSRVAAIAKSRGIEPAAIVGRTHLWARTDLKRFKPNPVGKQFTKPGPKPKKKSPQGAA
jgi:hypothetical protein